ncbi:hypothetical protein Q4489_04290 [Thalassotalea sp. 1_MG-2023]|uniref:hypothetical protein n=1 Tax=Thalassotalea sp. 1_MG-2023 TaxID=3062680 RepID=UPI0026E35843|nr:hypothetical protein [Thalassotalea sp. 1_MG-2023]MDO6426216.1 hypothetical protein [Thalassotalea sp. 1_MG-2023]
MPEQKAEQIGKRLKDEFDKITAFESQWRQQEISGLIDDLVSLASIKEQVEKGTQG